MARKKYVFFLYRDEVKWPVLRHFWQVVTVKLYLASDPQPIMWRGIPNMQRERKKIFRNRCSCATNRWAATEERLQFTSFSSKLYLAPAPPPLPFWTGATFNPIANSIKTFPARTPSTSCKHCWNRSFGSIYSARIFRFDQQISRKVQNTQNKWNIFF